MRWKIFTCGMLMVLTVAFVLAATITPTDSAAGEKAKVLIGFKEKPGVAEQAMVRGAGGEIKYTYHIVPAIAAAVPEAAIEGLRRNPNVTRVELDIKVYAIDAELDDTWGVKRIGAGVVHGYNKGTGVKVGIIDSGIDYKHPDLDANYVRGYDFVNDDDDPMDDAGHGTHVAGTVAAEDNEEGVVGVAPEAELYALKVLGANGSGSYSDVIAALQWAVDNGMQVTNNSYGSSGDPGVTVKAAFDNAYAAGVLNVCAAGNSGNPPGRGDNVIYPARYESCIAVAATDKYDSRASFSSTGPDVELAAPGVNIKSTVLGGGYEDGWNGTSMASPHVAGTAALVIANGTLTDEDGDGIINNVDVRLCLQRTANDLGDAGWDSKYGYGLVDADEAAPEPVDVHDVAVTAIAAPSSVVAGETASIDVTVENQGTFDETFDVVLTDDGVTIGTKLVSLAAGASTTVSFSWETTGATLGDHTLTATAGPVADETDTADNSKSTVVTVESAITDIAITAVSAPSSVVQGDVVDVSVTVENVGNQDVSADITVSLTDTPPADGTAGNVTGSPQTITGGLAAGASTTLTFSWDTGSASLGDHTLTASHDFSDEDASNDKKSTTMTVKEAVANIMYVESIVFSSKVAGRNKFLYTTVKVVDGGGYPLGGVSVEVILEHDESGSWNFAGDTGTDGTVKFTLLKAPSGYYTATVTNLILTDYTWDTTKGVTSASCELQDDGTALQGAAKAVALARAVNSLGGNYPNPANPETSIRFSISESGWVTLRVYNSLGQVVRTLVDEGKTLGTYTVRWDGKDDRGIEVSSGIYLYRIVAGEYSETKRMVMLR